MKSLSLQRSSLCAAAILLAAWLLPAMKAVAEEESDPVPVIDVLIAYTPAALAEAGSALPIQQMVDDADRVLLNSRARARVRLVHTAKVAYVEPYVYDGYGYQLTLDRLTHPQDGYLDELHSLREQYAADIVVLWAKSAQQGFEGFVAPLLPDAAHAFGVMFPQSSYDLARLLGRMLGCEAQPGPLDQTWRVVGEGAFPDSHAHVFTNWNYVNSTVMGARLNLTPFFSNPNLVCFESRLGIPGEADNVRTINLVAPGVAAFREADNSVSVPGVEWVSPLDGARFLPGSDITLDVLVSSPGAIQKVDLYKAVSYSELHDRSPFTNLTPHASGHFGLSLTNASPGWYRLSARATDVQGAMGQESIEFHVRAQNDDFTNRISLQNPTDRAALDLRGMTLEPGEAALVAPGVQATAWYTWTSPGEGYLQVRVRSTNYWSVLLPFVRAYFGPDLEHLTSSGGNPDRNSPLLLRVHPGDTVQLSVGYARTEAVPVELTANFLPLLTNDSFETRVPVAGAAVIVTGHNAGARSSTNAIWPNGMGPTAWWSWTPNVTGFAQIQASNFLPQQTIAVLKGAQPETLSDLAQFSPNYEGSVGSCFPVRAGEPLLVAVSSREGYPAGAFSFRLAVLEGAPNNTFLNRLTRAGSEWIEPLLFPVEGASGAPASVGPYATWWEWTAPQGGTVVVAISAWGAPNVLVFTGDSSASLQPVQTLQAGAGFATFIAAAGTRYHLALSWSSIPYYLGAGFAPVLHLGYARANDHFSNGTALGGPSVDWGLTRAYGTREQSEPNSPLASWWYSWTAPARGRVTLSATGQVAIAVFRGNALAQLTNVIPPQYWSALPTFVAEAGVEYRIQAWTATLDNLPVSAHMHLDFQPPPANDQFAGRFLLSGSDYTISADLALPTADPADPIIPGTSYRRTLWWRWIIPTDGVAKFSSSWAALGVYRLAENGTLVPVLSTTAAPKLLGVKAGEVLELMLAGEDAPYLSGLRLELLPSGYGVFANDSFAGRTELIPSNGDPLALGTSAGNTEGATREPGETLSGTNSAGHSRWATWKSPVPAMAKVSVSISGGGNGLYAEQFRGSQWMGLSTVAWKTGPYLVFRFHADPGIEYPLVIDSVGTNDVSYTIGVELTPDTPAPTNDLFQTAHLLLGPAAKVSGTHRTATVEPGEPAHGDIGPERSLWYRWTAPRTGSVRLSAKPVSLDNSTPYDLAPYPSGTLAEPHSPGFGVYAGNAVESLTAQSCWTIPSTNDYESTVEFDAIAGQSYALALEGGPLSDADVGEFEFQLVQLPTNDDLANRIILEGTTALLSGTVFGATRAANEWPAQGPSQSANTNLMNVWWEWTAPANLRVTLRNVRSNEHFWAVWRSTDQRQYPPRTSVMDRYFGWEDTRRDFVATAGQTYYIAVYAYPNNTTPVEIELEGVPVPANDNFAGRIPLAGERVSLATRGDNTSRELNEPPHGVGIVGIGYGNVTNAPSLWWSWTAPRSGLFALTTSPQEALRSQSAGRWDQVVRTECFLYQGDQITSLSLLAGTSPDTTTPPSGLKRVTFAAVAGNTYQIALCPIIREARVWDTTKYFVNLTIQPVTLNSSVDAALELTGSSASFSGNLSGEVDGLWWRWTAPASGSIYFAQRIGGADLTREVSIHRYTRNPTNGNLTLQNTTEVQAGETYWLKVSAQLLEWWETPPTWDGRDLPFEAALGLQRLPLSNDNFAQRERLTGTVAVLMGDNTDATREPGEPMHAGAPGRGSLWWQWTAPHSGRWTLDVVSSWYGPMLIDIYRGATLATLQRVPSDVNAMRSDVVFQAQAGETYSIVVDNPGYPAGAFRLILIEYLPPANDSFAGRILLSGSAPSWTASNSGASAEPGEPLHAGCAPAASVWYAWTAQKTTPVNLGVTSAGGLTAWAPPRVAVYRGDSLANLAPVGANRVGGDLTSNLVFRAEANVSYSIAIDTLPREIGGFRLTLNPTNAPLNDNFSDRLALTGSQVKVYALNTGATLEPGEPNPGEPDMGATLWWTWTAAGSGPVTIDTAGSSFDTRLAVYQGSALGTLSLVVGNDDAIAAAGSPVSFTSSVTFNASRGAAYQIQAGGLAGGFGRLTLNIAGQEAPPLPTEIVSAQVVVGSRTCQLHLRGTPGQVVSVQASSDFVNWQPVGSLRFVASDAVWSEPIAAGVATRFFRLVSPTQSGPPPQLLSAELGEGSATCRLYLRGTPGQDASVEGSSDLVNWESLDSVQFISADEVWSEPILPGVAARFYRLASH